MKTIPLTQIHIDQKRFREKVGDIGELATSMRDYGQLQPILLDGDNNLIAGFRRLGAAAILEWEEIGYERIEDLTLLQRREIELEENIRRLDMEWQERVSAIAEIDRLKREEDPEWDSVKTAAMVGITPRYAQLAVELTAHLDDPTIAQAKTIPGAIQRLQARKDIERRKAVVAAVSDRLRYKVHVGDCRRVLKEFPDEYVDCVITSPPFGVDLDLKGTVPYADEEEAVMSLVTEVVPELYRVLRPNCWAAIFFDIAKLYPWDPQPPLRDGGAAADGSSEHTSVDGQPVGSRSAVRQSGEGDPHTLLARPGLISILEAAGFSVNILPCIWGKPNKTLGAVRDPNTQLVVAYEAFVLAWKGDAVLSRKGRQNLFLYDIPSSSERVHPVQMAEDLCEELVSLLTIGGEVVLDPFGGSMMVGVGALNKQRNFIGIELSPQKAADGELLLKEALTAPKAG